MTQQKKSELIELFGLWEYTSQAGETYYSGKLGPGTDIKMFKNRFKTGNQPDWRVYVSKAAPKEKTDQVTNEDAEDLPF